MFPLEMSEPFDSDEWLFEINWDGYRVISEVRNDKADLYSKEQQVLNNDFPLLLESLKLIRQNVILDGVIVILNDNGKPDRNKLQNYKPGTEDTIVYYVFDILYENKRNLCDTPLKERKQILREILPESEIVKYSDHIIKDGISFFEAVKEMEMVGMIAKNTNSKYFPGKKTANWLKIYPSVAPQSVIVPPVKQSKNKTVTLDNIAVKLTNLNKVYFPDENITKGMIVDYYMQVSDYILPYLKDRPQSLKRNPGGISEKGFYHKDAGEEAPKWVKTYKYHSESGNRDIEFILCNDSPTLAYLNNLGCIEFNPWHSTIAHPVNPDYLIIDIDPSEKNTFNEVIDAANVIKSILDKAGATSLCKTSGATGLHIYIPLKAKYDYTTSKDFAHLVCMLANEQIPDFTTLERSLDKRKSSQIYLDFLQNRNGQTIASVYSVRPVPGATVSTPLDWNEVKYGLDPKQFDIFTIPERLKRVGDLFINVLGKGIDIKKCLKKLSNE